MSDGKLLFDTKIDSKGFKSGLDRLSSMASKVGKGVFDSFKIASAAMTAFAGYSVKAGMDFDASMSQVQAISGASGDELLALRDKAKEMGATTKFSASQSAEAMKYMGMAGWKSQEMLDGLPGIINLAAASGEDLGLVSDIVTDSLTAFKMQAKDTSKYVDILAAASTNSNTNVGLMGNTFQYVAPLAGALGYTAEDTAIAIGLMANAGVKGSRAGTALRGAFSRIAKPTGEAKAMMDKLGISITNIDGSIKPLNNVMGDLRKSLNGLSDDQKANAIATMFGQEAMSGMLAIINSSEDDFNKLTNSIYNSKGAAEEMARVMNDNLKGDITILRSALEGFGISVFENVDNPFRKAVQSVTKQVERLNKVVETDMSQVPRVLGDMIADGTVAISSKAPKFVSAGTEIVNSLLEGLGENSVRLSSSAVGLAMALANAFLDTGPKFLDVGLDIILKIGQGLADNVDTLTVKAIEAMGKLSTSFIKSSPKFIKIGADIIKGIAKGIAQNPDVIIKEVPKILTALAIAFSLFKGKKVGKDLIKSFVLGISGNSSMVKSAGEGIVSNLIKSIGLKGLNMRISTDILMDNFKNALVNKSTSIVGLGNNIIKSLTGGMFKGFGLITSVASKIIPLIAGILGNPFVLVGVGLLLIGAIIKGFNIDLPKIAHSAGEIVGKIARKITDGAKSLINSGKTLISYIHKGFKNGVKDFLDDPLVLVKKIFSIISGGAKTLFKAGASLAKGIKDGFNGKKKDVESEAKDLPKYINSNIDSSSTEESGQNMVQGLIEGLRDGTGDLSSAYKDLINNGVSQSDARAILRQEGQASIEEYAQAILGNGENVRSAYTAIRTSGLDTLQASEKFFEVAGLNIDGYVNGTEEGGQSYREKIQELMEAGFTELEAVEKTYEIAKANMQGYQQATVDSADGIKTEFQTLMKIGMSELEAFDQMYEKGQLNVGAFGQGSATGKENIYGIYQSLREAGLSPMDAVEALYGMGLANANGYAFGSSQGLEAIEIAYKSLSDTGLAQADIRDLLMQTGYNNVDAYIEALNTGRARVGESYAGLVQEPLSMRSALFDTSYQEDGKAKSTNFATGIELGKEDVNNSANNIRTAALNSLKEGSEQAIQSGKNISSNLSSGIDQGKGKVQTSIAAVETNIKTSLDKAKSHSSSTVNTMMAEMTRSVESGSNKVNQSYNNLSRNINNSTNNMSIVTNQSFKKMGIDISNSVQTSSSKVNQIFKQMSNQINNESKKMSSSIINISKQMMTSFNSNLLSGSNKAKATVKNMSDTMLASVNSFRGQFTSAGHNLIIGLGNGIYSGRSYAVNAAINVMRSAVVAAKRAAAIHSPSKIMRDEVGAMFSKGLGLGIEDKAKFVKEKARAVMDSLVDQAKADITLDLARPIAGGFARNFSYSGFDRYDTEVSVNNGDVITYVELDKKIVGKAIAPIVSREISKDKRRRL